MKILAIDPGNEYSAYVVYDTESHAIYEKGKYLNAEVLEFVRNVTWCCSYMAIEMPACYGMAVGRTVFDTCRWVGIFQSEYCIDSSYLVYRKAQNKEHGIDSVCMHICKNNRAKDSNVRQAIIDRYPATGGGKTPQIGTKAQPGPLYGVSKDVWAALAVAITFSETFNQPLKA
jgi:hypothetical protein